MEIAAVDRRSGGWRPELHHHLLVAGSTGDAARIGDIPISSRFGERGAAALAPDELWHTSHDDRRLEWGPPSCP